MLHWLFHIYKNKSLSTGRGQNVHISKFSWHGPINIPRERPHSAEEISWSVSNSPATAAVTTAATGGGDGGDYGKNHGSRMLWTPGTDVASTNADLIMGFGGDSYGGGYGGVGYTDLI
jgi:hypothetical protein